MAVVPILAQRRDDGDHAEDRSGEELHLLNGVSVDHDGPANVSKYFLPSIQECHVDMRVGDAKDASAASTSRLLQAARACCRSILGIPNTHINVALLN